MQTEDYSPVSSHHLGQLYARIAQVKTVLEEVIRLATVTELPFLAASIAYYAFATLIPFFIVTFIVISAIGSDDLAIQIITITQEFLTPTSQELIRDAVTSTEGRLGVIAGAIFLFIWSVFRLLRGLDPWSDHYSIRVGPSEYWVRALCGECRPIRAIWCTWWCVALTYLVLYWEYDTLDRCRSECRTLYPINGYLSLS